MERVIQTNITDREHNEILCLWLAKRFTYLDREAWQGEIENGRITVNDKAGRPEMVLTKGDYVSYRPRKLTEPPVSKEYSILYEDRWLLAVDKPANLPTHPSGRFYENTLWHILKNDLSIPKLHIINRLDRETSGIILVARDKESASWFSSQFKKGKVEKKYIALVSGKFPSFLSAEGLIINDRSSRIRKKSKFITGLDILNGEQVEGDHCLPALPSKGKGEPKSRVNTNYPLKAETYWVNRQSLHQEALICYLALSEDSKEKGAADFCEGLKTKTCLTYFRRLKYENGRSLIEARPVTGRCHQLRATLEGLGFPIVGDKLYGPDETIFLRFISGAMTDVDRSALVLDRQALHASEICIDHPRSHEKIQIKSPLPEDIRNIVTIRHGPIFARSG